jgi:glycosyltransferase involved in cell wall biosynthesis
VQVELLVENKLRVASIESWQPRALVCYTSTFSQPAVAAASTAGTDTSAVIQSRSRVLIHPFFFLAEAWNGMDEHLLLLSRHLDRGRFELLLLTHPSDGPQTQILSERAGIQPVPAPYAVGASAWTRLNALRRLYAIERIDLLHMHSPVAGGQAIPALAARLAGVSATIATYHQIQPDRLPTKTRVANYLTHTHLMDATIAVSQDVATSLRLRAGVPSRNLHVIHNGIDLPEPTSESASVRVGGADEILLGYFGRLSPEKGVSGLLDALALLARSCPRARTLIVGDGPERAALEAKAMHLGIADQVTFLGFRSDARVLMEQVDVVVHAPVYEGFGLVVLEAMAARRPVVGTNAPGGLAEMVVPEETGLLVCPGSADALAEALARLAQDAPARERMGRNGRARFEQHFSAGSMVERITTVYDSSPARPRHGSRLGSPRPALT